MNKKNKSFNNHQNSSKIQKNNTKRQLHQLTNGDHCSQHFHQVKSQQQTNHKILKYNKDRSSHHNKLMSKHNQKCKI